MAIFPSRKFRPTNDSSFASRGRILVAKHPFVLFGLPFIATMLLGSFFLTPATALRYERHDRKVRQLTKDEELGIGKDKRRIDLKEEYYVCIHAFSQLRGIRANVIVCRNSLPKISTTGSRNASSDCLASTMEFSESCYYLICVPVQCSHVRPPSLCFLETVRNGSWISTPESRLCTTKGIAKAHIITPLVIAPCCSLQRFEDISR